MLSPGFVSYHVSNFAAPCHPASSSFPSIVIGPAARLMRVTCCDGGVSAAASEQTGDSNRTTAREFLIATCRRSPRQKVSATNVFVAWHEWFRSLWRRVTNQLPRCWFPSTSANFVSAGGLDHHNLRQ